MHNHVFPVFFSVFSQPVINELDSSADQRTFVDQILTVNLIQTFSGLGQSGFQREVGKLVFSGPLKHQKANRLLTLNSLESCISASSCVFCCLCSMSVSLSPFLFLTKTLLSFHFSYPSFSVSAVPIQVDPDQIEPLVSLLPISSSASCSPHSWPCWSNCLSSDHICCFVIALFDTSFGFL